ncbi:hypothetical protein HJP15_10020 [Pseudoalteromonas sp. NEC-BIFX-2020_002]|uniref:polymorphic toxin-type HINT domain-containing protein n=1 Tax=Pseudoalteromonas sp. NEC-BIFX-2020_002 TaxID=2732353 RepID=UPI001476A15D|nr:polymorphic toxin-type HINT domain-containing protein [Pseudoalteromonas sp. NEC-BIFX-2020_002]NNG43247.1 hypothetical protein [Pseudoalteromonas sp. NEC-BIFX-2020_002]
MGANVAGLFIPGATGLGLAVRAGDKGVDAANVLRRTCCFVAGTQVLTKGGYKNIEDVKLGENLWAKNTETGEQDWKPVTKVFIEPDRGIFEIKLVAGDGFEQKIQATDDHPFYVIGKGWKQTIELKFGDKIETDGNGAMEVVSVIDEQRLDLTYNFTVADFHTYYVTKKNVLVHNCNLHSTSKSVDKAFKKNSRLQVAFEKATGKGEVDATGQEGIKALKGSKYTHEVKFKSKEFGDVRILGNKQENGTFKWEKATDHKGVKRS